MHNYLIVDAFARAPLEGNPVAVFFDAADLSAERMQRIAAEMNLSEVTFVLPAKGDGDAHIRIFTPVTELAFAGHPILGTAVALGQTRRQNHLRLETEMGIIALDLVIENDVVADVTMQQPIPTWERYVRSKELLAALGVEESGLPVEAYRNGPRHVLVWLETVAALTALQPDHRALGTHPDMSAICLAKADDHIRCRMFSPAYGVVEDAATGSAAGPIAIHLARHGLTAYGDTVEILQGVEMGRPSLMRATAESDEQTVHSVRVNGPGVITAKGTLYL